MKISLFATIMKRTMCIVMIALLAISCSVKAQNKTALAHHPTKIKPLDIDTSQVYSKVDQMPQFPGGEIELLKFISEKMRHSSFQDGDDIQGKVICRFIIDIDGSVIKPEVIRSLTLTCDKEAIRVIKLLPKFTPGKQNGKNVRVWYIIPVTFKLE